MGICQRQSGFVLPVSLCKEKTTSDWSRYALCGAIVITIDLEVGVRLMLAVA